jgi:ABC-2 type transport system permease protein
MKGATTMLNLLWHELRSHRAAIIGWGLGLCFFPVVYVGLYPSFAEQLPNFQEMMDLPIYQALGISMASFEGYMASTVNNLVPVILAIYAISSGTSTLAGEEESGRLEMIAALPLPRRQIVLAKALALALSLLLILAIVSAGAALTLAAIGGQITSTVTPLGVFTGLLAAWPLVTAFGMISLFLSAFASSRRIALALSAAVVIASFLGNNLAGMVDALDAIKQLFLFYFYDSSAEGLINGQDPVNLLVLGVVALAALGLAIFFFSRRDLTVGAWPWQRRRPFAVRT